MFNKGKISKYMKQYYLENKEKIKKQHKEYRKTHKTEIKKYNLNHQEEIKKYGKEYYLKHKEKIKEKSRNYKRNNKQKTLEHYISPGGIYHTFKFCSKKRNIIFSIKKEDFIIWYQNQPKICYYCGRTLKEIKQDTMGHNNRLSIDRKDNNKTYTINNIVLACFRCNTIKSDYFTEKEMLEIGKIIKNKQKMELTL